MEMRVIEKLFLRLEEKYGEWDHSEQNKVVWLTELKSFAHNLHLIKLGLINLTDKAPTAKQFKESCNISLKPRGEMVDHKRWAKVILQRHEAGEDVKPISLRFAREALKVHDARL